MLRGVAVVGLLIAAAVALPHNSFLNQRSTLETELTNGPPSDWKLQGPASPEALLDVTAAVALRNTEELIEQLTARSDPDNKLYGQWLDKAQVEDLTNPLPEQLAVVSAWLSTADGASSPRVSGGFVTVTMPVAAAEELLQTSFSTYRHAATNHVVTRCTSYTVPAVLAPHLDFMAPTLRFPTPRIARSVNADASVNPALLRKLYSVGDAKGAQTANSQAVAQFLEQYYAPSDLAQFFTDEMPSEEGQTPKVVGPNKPAQPGIEASLDIEYIMAMGDGVPTDFWYTEGRQPHSSENEPFLVWLFNVGNASTLPHVFSVSYGDDEKTVDPAYAQRVSLELAKIGSRGVSLLFASGDDGVGSNGAFRPNFPATSPWVTSVGGTILGNGDSESAWSSSSGGFSNFFPRPSYQDKAVAGYIAEAGDKLPPQRDYNATGRGYPDVAAMASGFDIVVGGGHMGVAGTSCASPTFAGVVGLLNDLRLASNKPPLGFLNPLLYSHLAPALNDITQGQNGYPGFQALKGWDPVTGFGTPNYAKLKTAVDALP